MSEPSKHTHPGDGTVPGLHGEPIPTPVLGCPACSTVHSIGDQLGAAPAVSEHSVRLPYPDRNEPTVASCAAGDWTITYEWGGHEDAAAAAGEHVGDATLTHPVRAVEMSGEVLVMPGRSR